MLIRSISYHLKLCQKPLYTPVVISVALHKQNPPSPSNPTSLSSVQLTRSAFRPSNPHGYFLRKIRNLTPAKRRGHQLAHLEAALTTVATRVASAASKDTQEQSLQAAVIVLAPATAAMVLGRRSLLLVVHLLLLGRAAVTLRRRVRLHWSVQKISDCHFFPLANWNRLNLM